jgi:hypothetical protein
MKYFIGAVGATIAILIIVVLSIRAVNRANSQDEAVSPCSAKAIVTAKNPDARFSHCHDKDWDGSTLLRDRLAESNEQWEQYQILYEGSNIGRLMSVPNGMTTDDDLP